MKSMAKKKLSLLICSVLVITGCSMAPKYKRPMLPISDKYSGDHVACVQTVLSEVDWNEYFADPYLQQLIATALENNRDLRISLLHVEEAQAAYGIRRSNQFPNIDVAAGGSRMHSSEGLFQNNYYVGLDSLSWEIDFWGKIKNLKNVALENFFATEAANRAIKLSIITNVADNYILMRELEARLILANKNVANYKEHLNIYTKRFKVGEVSQIELVPVKKLLADAEMLVVKLEERRAMYAHALSLLIGTPLPVLPPIEFNENIILHKLRAGLPSELLIKRPDIIASEHKLKATGANIGAARAAFFPSITLTGLFGSVSSEFGQLFSTGQAAWLFAPRISMPIFDAGRTYTSLKLAKIRNNIAVANYEKTIQTAFREVSDALTMNFSALRSVQLQEQKLAADKKQEGIAITRYHNGSISYLDLLEVKKISIQSEQQLIEARSRLLSSRIHLYTALGGGRQTVVVNDINKKLKVSHE